MVDLLHLFQPNEVFNPKPKQQGGSGVLDSEPELRDALLTAWNKGYMAPMTTMEMMGVAQERGELLRGLEHGTRKTIEAVSFMFMGAERMNRLTSYIAAYRVANQPGMKEKILATLKDNALAQLAFRSSENFPAAFAEWVVDETQFRTGRVNRAELQRGVGTALLQFKDFPWQMIEFYARTARLAGPRGKVAFAMMMLLMLLLAGVWGLPFGDNFRRVIESVLKMITERDRDLKVELREKIKELTGSKRIAEMVSYGVVRGIDESPEMSSRVGLGSILPDFTKPEQLLGIPGDLFYSRPKKAIEWFKRDEKQLSIASVLPNVLKNVVEAEYWSQEGVRPQPATGGRVLGPEQLSTSDIVWKGLGARTRRVAEASEEGMMIQRMAHAQDEMRRNYYYRIGVNLAREVMARNVGNADAEVQAAKRVQEALTEIRAYNEGKPVHQQIVLNLRSLGEVVGRELVGTKFQDARLPRISRQRAAEIRALSGSNEAEPEWLQ
jgi:hypothetical protein